MWQLIVFFHIEYHSGQQWTPHLGHLTTFQQYLLCTLDIYCMSVHPGGIPPLLLFLMLSSNFLSSSKSRVWGQRVSCAVQIVKPLEASCGLWYWAIQNKLNLTERRACQNFFAFSHRVWQIPRRVLWHWPIGAQHTLPFTTVNMVKRKRNDVIDTAKWSCDLPTVSQSFFLSFF